MEEYGVSYNSTTGELIVGDLSMKVGGRWKRFLLGQQNINFGNPAQWDTRATTWARTNLGRNDILVHVIQTTPIPIFALMFGETVTPTYNWWEASK